MAVTKLKWRTLLLRNRMINIIILVIAFIILSQIYLDWLVLDEPSILDKPSFESPPTVHEHQEKQINIPLNTVTYPPLTQLQKNIIQRTTPTHLHCLNPYLTNHSNATHPKYKQLEISKLPNNWIYFANRCQMNKQFEHNSHGDFDSIWMNSKIGYLHNYKCAGSTIQYMLHKLLDIDLKGDFIPFNDIRRD
eukprot:791895_1